MNQENPEDARIACVICGEPLSERSYECQACASHLADPVPLDDEVAKLARRARGWALICWLFLPLVSSLVALHYCSKASELYRSRDVVDRRLEAEIKRTQVAAGVLFALILVVILGVKYS